MSHSQGPSLFNTFSHNNDLTPLAERLRPKKLNELIGHSQIIGPNSKMGQILRKGHIPNLILWGPPGCGKTTFALTLKEEFNLHYIAINAVDSGSKILRTLGEEGRERKQIYGTKTLLFVDEIHRFNKGQQDVLLPSIEKGDLILMGATTENPSYELNRALLSRCRVLVFNPLEHKDFLLLIKRIEEEIKTPLTDFIKEGSLEKLIPYASGDARKFINAIELCYQFYTSATEKNKLSQKDIEEILLDPHLGHDKQGDSHYDLISALIKSLRGSDPDASLYYLARLIQGGEDPVFIARRLIILASEDIGNADPRALTLAVSTLQAVEAIGLPEAGICLAQAVTYLASTPKSNSSYKAYKKALAFTQETKNLPIPLFLRSSRTTLSQELGYGKGYLYPHDFPNHYVTQEYMPKEAQGVRFFENSNQGHEKYLKDYQEWLKKIKEK